MLVLKACYAEHGVRAPGRVPMFGVFNLGAFEISTSNQQTKLQRNLLHTDGMPQVTSLPIAGTSPSPTTDTMSSFTALGSCVLLSSHSIVSSSITQKQH